LTFYIEKKKNFFFLFLLNFIGKLLIVIKISIKHLFIIVKRNNNNNKIFEILIKNSKSKNI